MFLPVYTVVNDCQDCYKCVRACPMKAIEVRDGHARVTRESCVLCGRCVTVCPVGADGVICAGLRYEALRGSVFEAAT